MTQNTEVARWAIELDAQSDISRMLNPPTPYIEEEPDDEDESTGREHKAIEPSKFSETYTGFLGWLQSKEIRQGTVRELAQKSFNGKKIPSDQSRNLFRFPSNSEFRGVFDKHQVIEERVNLTIHARFCSRARRVTSWLRHTTRYKEN